MLSFPLQYDRKTIMGMCENAISIRNTYGSNKERISIEYIWKRVSLKVSNDKTDAMQCLEEIIVITVTTFSNAEVKSTFM